MLQDSPCIFLPGRLPGDDHRTGRDILLANAGPRILFTHDFCDRIHIQFIRCQQRRQVYRSRICHFAFRDLDMRRDKTTAPVLQRENAEYDLQCRRSHIDSDTLNDF